LWEIQQLDAGASHCLAERLAGEQIYPGHEVLAQPGLVQIRFATSAI
jgi:hypothetical protein